MAMEDLNYAQIGHKIKKRRQQMHLTQEYVANQLDINPSHISNIENGRANPSLTLLVNVANILACSVDCFIDGEYRFKETKQDAPELDAEIQKKLKYYTKEKKTRLLKMMDLME